MSRPFFKFRVSELEAEFAGRKGDLEFLRDLVHELGFRSTDKASRLKAEAIQALAGATSSYSNPEWVGEPVPPSIPHTGTPLRTELRASPPPRQESAEIPARHIPTSPLTNVPSSILDAWTALEVLSPPTFRRPEELAGGDRQAVAWIDREHLPWEGNGERARRNTRLFYQVVLGTVDLELAVAQCLARYVDSRIERPATRGEAILAVVIVDRDGRLVETPAVSVSSFGWGVPRALQGDLATLADWRKAERSLVEGLDEILRHMDEDGEDRPLDRSTIMAGYQWLVATLDLPAELAAPPRFAIRVYEFYKSSEPPEPLLLNSFFLNDLAAAKALFIEGRATHNLRRYLGCDAPATRHDLLHDTTALESAVAPERIPPARWPGEGRHPLVLLQQAAINLTFQELKDTGILAVNGPPGTGKTTLLRDLVAANVTARAEAMAGFDDPATAFIPSGEKLKAGQAWLHLYRLDSRLKGFEMLVASSNNRAVENVSAELPGLKKVAEDATDLRYFTTLSDALRQSDTWGLIAAVLGNAGNRGRFKRTFWWDDDVGLSTYLAEAAGTPQFVERVDPETGARETRPPRIVCEEDPPRSHEEALLRWRQACTKFCSALEKSRKMLAELAKMRDMAASLAAMAQEEADATSAEAVALALEARTRVNVEATSDGLMKTQRDLASIERSLAEHDRVAPGFFARLFRTPSARDWRSARSPLEHNLELARQALSLASQSMSASESAFREATNKRQAAERQRATAINRHTVARHYVDAARERIGARFIDAGFFAREHSEKHKAAPWINEEQQRIRDDVFVAAVALHKAFIDAAAKPLRHNLGVLMNTFGSRPLPTPEKRALMPDLWASLFLVVPLVSTTFASVERMLGSLPAEGLGWLFVDEAGQALPQAAVGALLRSRRAVVVGDPVQIEPIVTLPDTLTQSICRYFGVDPDRFNAPNASVQTLADAATPYIAEFQGKHGSRTVGVPLLVHRRCAEPMFGISNTVAYERLMVNAKAPAHSPISEVLGPSAWIDVRGGVAEKWCPEEGEAVLLLLRRLANAAVIPDVYIVTPFVIVADNLRKLVRESGVLTDWTDDPWRWTSERIGTVHTVQGREAEAVIFVLGAPALHQAGARGWAGGFPNLLNVAVTRAKERLYVVGNRHLWRSAGLFRELDARLPASDPPPGTPPRALGVNWAFVAVQ